MSKSEPEPQKPRGGPQEAYFSEEMFAGRFDFYTLHAEYKAIKEEGGARWEELVRKGKAATQAGRSGVRHAFIQPQAPPIVPAERVRSLFAPAS